jgi:Sec-independent protein secretion pathway component TatC
VAVPLIILYEISIVISKRVDKQRKIEEAQWD